MFIAGDLREDRAPAERNVSVGSNIRLRWSGN